MKSLCLSLICFGLLLSCKHDHPHAPDGSHVSSDAVVGDSGHNHDGHDHSNHEHDDHDHHHDAHNHDNHQHDDHQHDSHQHDGHDHSGHDHSQDSHDATHNTLSANEKVEGWTLLFDGRQLDQWSGYRTGISPKWSAEDGTLHFNPDVEGEGGDIVTKNEYQDFELKLDWKISKCGNSGVFWNVVQADPFDRVYQSAPEMQILDNTCHPDAKIIKHKAGDLYDLIETSSMTVNPAMQWNSIRIVSKDSHYEFYQNGVKVVEFNMHDENWRNMLANSKFKQWPDFGKAKRGHLSLQDHGDKVWFRNIKVREI